MTIVPAVESADPWVASSFSKQSAATLAAVRGTTSSIWAPRGDGPFEVPTPGEVAIRLLDDRLDRILCGVVGVLAPFLSDEVEAFLIKAGEEVLLSKLMLLGLRWSERGLGGAFVLGEAEVRCWKDMRREESASCSVDCGVVVVRERRLCESSLFTDGSAASEGWAAPGGA